MPSNSKSNPNTLNPLSVRNYAYGNPVPEPISNIFPPFGKFR